MIWDEAKQDKGLLNFIKKLNTFRKDYISILNHHKIDWFNINENKTLAFQRQKGKEELIFFFNQNDKNVKINNPKNATEILSNLTVNSIDNFVIQPNGFIIFHRVI